MLCYVYKFTQFKYVKNVVCHLYSCENFGLGFGTCHKLCDGCFHFLTKLPETACLKGRDAVYSKLFNIMWKQQTLAL